MHIVRLMRFLGMLFACAWLAACGGGSAPPDADEIALERATTLARKPVNDWQPPSRATPSDRNYVYLESDAGDYIGLGRKFLFTQANAIFTVDVQAARLNLMIRGDITWNGMFHEFSRFGRLKRGLFLNAQRAPFQPAESAGLSWSGDGRGCNTLTGWFSVDEVEYENGELRAFELRFEQHCEGFAPALRGKIRWRSNDRTQPPGPVTPPPANLWAPAVGSTPSQGNYVYLTSEPGNYVGQGRTLTYSLANALLTVSSNAAALNVAVNGDTWWYGNFQAMNTLTKLQPGFYGGLLRWPFHNPTVGGLDWSGDGRGCNAETGWFVIDKVTYTGEELTAVDLRFEQHCEGMVPALRGKIHWVKGDMTGTPSGPANPPPADLWQPAPGATPAAGNYVFLQSDAGDPVGQGATYSYTPANAAVSVSSRSGYASISVFGDRSWSGEIQAMAAIDSLQPGYYPDAQGWPSMNPVRPRLNWGTLGSCYGSSGWFVIDSIRFSGTDVVALDLRFEQRCAGSTAALRGKVHWVAGDTTGQVGPVSPPPAGLWAAAPGSTPASGNYVYLQSDPGDYVGQGLTLTYTSSDALLSLTTGDGNVSVNVTGDKGWSGQFQAMSGYPQLVPGYYAGLMRWPFHNPARGGLNWSGDGRGCNTLSGWFIVDAVTYTNGALTALDLRFEQHCEGGPAALHGQIHWRADDAAAPPGPVTPPPAGLWEPAPGSTPASGNYVLLQSDAGDYIGGGQTITLTGADSTIAIYGYGAYLNVNVNGSQSWWGDFQGMLSLSSLQPGYYGNLARYPFHNPIKGGLNWSGQGRGCNTLAGWFVVDSITYVNGVPAGVDLRFEQHCEGGAPALHGKIHIAPP